MTADKGPISSLIRYIFFVWIVFFLEKMHKFWASWSFVNHGKMLQCVFWNRVPFLWLQSKPWRSGLICYFATLL